MTEAQLMDLSVLSQNFPSIHSPEVHRDNVIEALELMLAGDVKLVVIEGRDGIGKTTLLAQFVRRHAHRAMSVFISYTSRWAHDPKILSLDLYRQIYWAIHREVPDATTIDDNSLRLLFFKLGSQARLRNEIYYFVLDGLDEIPEDDSHAYDLILGILPFGFNQFRFLLSGEYNKITSAISARIPSKPLQLVGFVPDEAIHFLNDLIAEKETIDEVCRLCGRVPGYLASVRRSLEAGMSVDEILSGDPTRPLHFLELEWSRTVRDNSEQITLLAILAHDRRKHSIASLSAVVGCSEQQIQSALINVSFVHLDPNTGDVGFVSEAFRKFAAAKLSDTKKTVNELLIRDLMKQPSSSEALSFLPSLFEEQGQYDNILTLLSAEHLAKILASSQSLIPVQQKAALGVKVAKALARDADLVKFGMQKSALTELDVAEEWRAEIEARIALKDYDAALALAQSSVLKEDRLQLMAIIARKKRETRLTLDQELIDHIKQLYSEIDPGIPAKRAQQIADDLIFSMPELAIELVEKATGMQEGENALDWALANLSIATMASSSEGPSPVEERSFDTHRHVSARIKDPKAKQISAAASFFFRDLSAAEILAEAEKLQGASDRLFILRNWTRTNSDSANAADVVSYALRIAIGTAPYTFNATVLRELAIPLPFVDDHDKLRHLLGIFDSQRATVEPIGPTEDFMRLQLLLARAEAKFDFEAARNRIADVYLLSNEVSDLGLKVVCLSWLATTLTIVDPELRLEHEYSDRVHSSAQQELKTSLEELLKSTASHYEVTKQAIGALARYRTDLAAEVAMSLNTESRRDAALLELFESAMEARLEKIDFALLDTCIDLFVSKSQRDEALIVVIDRLSEESKRSRPFIPESVSLLRKLATIASAVKRTRGCCLGYILLSRLNDNEYDALASLLLDEMERAWSSIDPDWVKIKSGFYMAESLAEFSLEKAREYAGRTERIRDETTISTGTAASAYIACLRLTIRSFQGLLPRNIDADQDVETIARLIGAVPCKGERAGLWAELAVRLSLSQRSEECKRIVANHIRPILQSIPDGDLMYLERLTIVVAPALYCAHPSTALETVAGLTAEARDDAYSEIADLILHKLPSSEPHDFDTVVGFDLEYTDVSDLCELIERMDRDRSIYYYVKCIADSLTSNKYRDKLTRAQKQNVLQRLQSVTGTKLPDVRNIKHSGYIVATEIQYARIENSINAVSSQTWMNLSTSVRAVPNLADRAYVLMILASSLPAREAVRRDQLFEEARELSRAIPAHFDRIEHFESLALLSSKSNQTLARRCIEDALNSAAVTDDTAMYAAQRRLLDLAYKLDPNLAVSLASVADNDPAKLGVQANLQQQLSLNKLKKRMIEDASLNESSLSAHERKNFPNAAWRNLGALNSNRIGDVHIEKTRDWIQAAGTLTLDQSYPIFAWAIENANRRLRLTDQAKTHLRPIFEATIEATNLCARMAARSSIIVKKAQTPVTPTSIETSRLVRSGEREAAISFLKTWFEDAVTSYLTICDAYFGPEDLEVLQLLQSVRPGCQVQILTSRKRNENLRPSIEEGFRSHWKLTFDQDPPDTKIVIAGTEVNGQLPIHDRWWLTEGAGLRIGTSYNSLGLKRDSEISLFSREEAERCEIEVTQYLEFRKREHEGHRIQYLMITM